MARGAFENLFKVLSGILTGMRIQQREQEDVDKSLHELEPFIAKVRLQSDLGTVALGFLTEEIAKLLTVGDNDIREKASVLAVIEQLRITQNMTRTLSGVIDKLETEYADDMVAIDVTSELGRELIHQLATLTQVLHSTTLPILAATSAPIMTMIVTQVVEIGMPTLIESAEGDPDLFSRFAKMVNMVDRTRENE